jgi:ribonuclease P protein component
MLPRAYSLRGESAFRKIKKHGKLYQSKNFGVSVLKRDNDKHSRFGVIISTKISKSAVNRNRVTRAIKLAIRNNLFRIPTNYDMVFLTKKGIVEKLTGEIMREIDNFFKKNFVSKKQ